jgi:hypothetical protein
MASYADKDDFAQEYDYANWTTFNTAKGGKPSATWVENALNQMTRKINSFIGCYPNNVTSTNYTNELKDQCIRMVIRKLQVRTGQGMVGNIPFFSPNDFLVERERDRLYEIGLELEHRVLGGFGTS